MANEETFISFETAKLLKKCGLPQCERNNGYAGVKYNVEGELTSAPYANHYRAITQSIALKWLREAHKYHIMVDCHGTKNWLPAIQHMTGSEDYIVEGGTKKFTGNGFDTYEEAVEEALKYCLTNLIYNNEQK